MTFLELWRRALFQCKLCCVKLWGHDLRGTFKLPVWKLGAGVHANVLAETSVGGDLENKKCTRKQHIFLITLCAEERGYTAEIVKLAIGFLRQAQTVKFRWRSFKKKEKHFNLFSLPF